MILDENPNFSQKFVKNLHIFFIQNSFFFFFLILLDLFYDCANFQVNRSISCRDLRGAKIPPPPPPQWTQVLKITQWD